MSQKFVRKQLKFELNRLDSLCQTFAGPPKSAIVSLRDRFVDLGIKLQPKGDCAFYLMVGKERQATVHLRHRNKL